MVLSLQHHPTEVVLCRHEVRRQGPDLAFNLVTPDDDIRVVRRRRRTQRRRPEDGTRDITTQEAIIN